MTFKGKTIHMIKIRNPWGMKGFSYSWNEKRKEMDVVSNSSSNGVFFMELTHFIRTFGTIS